MICKIIINEKINSGGVCRVLAEQTSVRRGVLYDTFDYLLAGAGACLIVLDGGGVLFYHKKDLLIYGSLEEALQSGAADIIAPRVLMEKHSITLTESAAVLLDDLEKTIARGSISICATGGKECGALMLEPLLGYGDETEEALGLLECRPSGFSGAFIIEAVRQTGDRMLDYSSKPSPEMDAQTELHDVMRQIYSHLTDVMLANKEGIINDIDIEFLHDFRVSVRRLRSAMSIVRGVFDKDTEKVFRQRFRELGALTGTARDMDVYLYGMDGYRRLLPDWLQSGLDELEVYFKKVRTEEYKKLADYLKSGELETLCGDWQLVINSKESVTDKGRKSVLSAAKKTIYKAFCEIEAQAGELTHESHSDAVHAVRISFKKLRYLLEFFSALFEKEQTAPMLKDMKVLQDSLGDHNDYHVQQIHLRELVEKGGWSVKTSAAFGYLCAELARRQAEERQRALELINAFMAHRGLFEELFS